MQGPEGPVASLKLACTRVHDVSLHDDGDYGICQTQCFSKDLYCSESQTFRISKMGAHPRTHVNPASLWQRTLWLNFRAKVACSLMHLCCWAGREMYVVPDHENPQTSMRSSFREVERYLLSNYCGAFTHGPMCPR